jgi:uncharacterized protein involved in outer membrane biogenesis
VNWRKVSLWSGCGILLLLLLAVGLLFTSDLGGFKPQVERWVSDNTGRHFSIDGEFEVSLGKQIVVIAQDVRLANASWSDNALMLDIGDVEVRVNTWSLLSGPIEIELIRLDDTSIHLELSDSLEPNWLLTETTSGGATVDWLVKQIDVKRLRLVYVSPERIAPLDLRVERLSQRHLDDDFLELTMRAKIDDRDIELQAKAGTWNALLKQKDIDYELQAQLDTLKIVSQGYIDDLIDPRRPSLDFSAQAPNINDLARILQIPERGAGNIDLAGSLTPADDGLLVLNVAGNLGRMQTDATGRFSDLQSLEQADLDLTLSGPDLGQVLGLFGVHQYSGVAFELNIDAERDGPMIIVSEAHASIAEAEFDLAGQLPKFPSLDDSNLHLEIVGTQFERFRETLQLPGAATGPYSLTFDLNVSPDGVEIVRLDVESSLVKVTADGKLDESPGYVGSEFQFDVTLNSLGSIGSAYDIGSFSDRAVRVAGAALLTQEGLRTSGPVNVYSEDVEATVDGLIALTHRFNGSDIAIGLRGSNLSELVNELASVKHIPAQAYDVDARLRIADNAFHFDEVTGTVGRSSVNINALLSIGKRFSGTEIDFEFAGPAIEELTAAFGNQSFRPGAYDFTGQLSMTDDAIRFDDVMLSRDHGQINGDLTLALPLSRLASEFNFSASGDDLRSLIGKVYRFEANEAKFSISAQGALEQTQVLLRKLDISIGDAVALASGDIDFGESSRSTRFSFDINIPNLADLGTFNGRRMREQSLVMNASVEGADGVLLVDDMTVRLGDSDIHGTARLEKGDTPNFSMEISSDSIQFAPLMEEHEAAYDPAPKFADGRLIPNFEIPFERMMGLNATVKLNIGEFQRDVVSLSDVKLDAALQNGEFILHDFKFQAPAGWMQARGSLASAHGSGKATFEATGRGVAFGLSQLNSGLSAASDIDINLQSTGADLRTLAGNLNGIIFHRSSNIVIPRNRFLTKLYGDMVTEIISTVNPFSKTDTVQRLDCAIISLEVSNGIMVTQPYVLFLATKARMVANASINLQSEKIDIRFQTTPRKGFTLSAGEILNPYVKIVGTLAQPSLAVDEQGVLISGGAAVATGGLSILAKAGWERLSRTKKPCQDAVEQGTKMLGDRFPSFGVEGSFMQQ